MRVHRHDSSHLRLSHWAKTQAGKNDLDETALRNGASKRITGRESSVEIGKPLRMIHLTPLVRSIIHPKSKDVGYRPMNTTREISGSDKNEVPDRCTRPKCRTKTKVRKPSDHRRTTRCPISPTTVSDSDPDPHLCPPINPSTSRSRSNYSSFLGSDRPSKTTLKVYSRRASIVHTLLEER